MPTKTSSPPKGFVPTPDTEVIDVDAAPLGATVVGSASGSLVKRSPGSSSLRESSWRRVASRVEEPVSGPLQPKTRYGFRSTRSRARYKAKAAE